MSNNRKISNETGAFPTNGQEYIGAQKGMSKRFYAACQILCSLITINGSKYSGSMSPDLIRQSYAVADELISQEKD